MSETYSVLFVCLGNICRSPLAEAALRREAERRGAALQIDSAGTGDWHIGHPPDRRAQAVAKRNGVDIGHLRARQVTPQDFRDHDMIVALDAQNLSDLEDLRPADGTAELVLLLDLVEGRAGQGVKDPYYEEDDAFDESWSDVVAGAGAIMDRLEAG